MLRAAAWFYVVPRASKSILVLAVVGLAAFAVFAALALNILHRLAP